MKHRILAAYLSIPVICFGQTTIQDAQPLDVRQLLEALKTIREQNETGLKSRKQHAYTQVMAAAASGTAAAAFWKQAVKEVQFDGAEHKASKLSEWRDGDGEALSSKECQNAARLHLYWLGISLQHAMGTETKPMLQNIIEFTKQVRAEEDVMEKLNTAIERAKERKDNKDANADQTVKRVHEQILRMAVGTSPVARWLQLADLLGDDGKKRGARNPGARGEAADGGSMWEFVPGNIEGIYGSIILPEFRASKDPRLLEYWDLRIKLETERVTEAKLDVEQRDWAQIKRPNLLWSRAQDVLLLGQKNRAITEMFNLVKTHPQHPNVTGWISAIEGILAAAAAPAVSPAPAAPAGGVAAPIPVPPATAPTTPTVDPFRLNPNRPAAPAQ